MTPVAIPSYESEADFKAVLAMLPANEAESPISYAEMVNKVAVHEKAVQMAGHIPMRVKVEPIPLKRWCDANSIPVCRKSITAYITGKMASPMIDRGNN